MDRRGFLRAGTAFVAAAAANGGAALLAPPVAARADGSGSAAPDGPYGSIAHRTPDANGLVLPEGFTSRIMAVGGEPVGSTGVTWHPFPDGGACFPTGDGGWVYVSNSEVPAPGAGGASALRFAPDGSITGAHRICEGTMTNCAGGATPWRTWLSCEEDAEGLVWECDPLHPGRPAIARPALGRFTHEAVAVDPQTGRLYLTEDLPTGLLYRFTPASPGDLSSGTLHAALVQPGGAVTWVPVDDPGARRGAARDSAPGATRFDGGEGICVVGRVLVFTTKGTGEVHQLHLDQQRHTVRRPAGPPLTGVDNVTADPATGDLYIAEDAGDMELVLLTEDGVTAPFCRMPGQDASEVTGPAFSPDRTRLYVSSQRGPSPKAIRDVVPMLDAATPLGVTYEITGPFRTPAPGAVATGPSGARIVRRSGDGTDAGLAGSSVPRTVTLGAGAAALVTGGALALRRRTAR